MDRHLTPLPTGHAHVRQGDEHHRLRCVHRDRARYRRFGSRVRNGLDQQKRVKGTIKSITDFGVFVGLPGGIDGLVHLSDLSWADQGDEVEAAVLAIDTERERISLGIKQLDGDPFNNYAATHEKGSMVNGTIKEVDAKGATIELDVEVEGYLRASEISRDRVEDARNHLKEGDAIEAMVINVDRKTRILNLSLKAADSQETAQQLERQEAETGASSGTTNLGALLRAKLDGDDTPAE